MPHSSSSSASSRSISPSPPPSSSSKLQGTKAKLSSSQPQDAKTNENPEDREDPHTAAARRLSTRAWTASNEAHLRSLHRLTYADARFNPPPPSVWKRAALVAVCVVLVWWAFSARLGMWERKREGGRRAFMHAKQRLQAMADTSFGAQKTRPAAVPAFERAVPARDEI